MKVIATNLSEVTWMVLVKIDSMVVHAASITATSRVLPMFTYKKIRYSCSHKQVIFNVCEWESVKNMNQS